MGKTVKKVLNRLQQAVERLINPERNEKHSQLILQPVRNRPIDKNNLRGNLR